MLVGAGDVDIQADVVAADLGGNGLDRRGEIGHVQLLHQVVGQCRVEQVHLQRGCTLVHRDIHPGPTELHQHPAFAVVAAAEIDAGNLVLLAGRSASHARGGTARLDGQHHLVALDVDIVAGAAGQVDDQSRAAAG